MRIPEPDDVFIEDPAYWREEAFGERPILNPWGAPHHPPEKEESEK